MGKPRRRIQRRREPKRSPAQWQAEVDSFRRELDRHAPKLYVHDFDPAFRRLGDQQAAPPPHQAPRPAKRRARKKLTDAAWQELVRRHPLDKIGPNGKRIGAPTLTRLLRAEQGLIVDRATATRRLQISRPK